jgi:hypothetical protein
MPVLIALVKPVSQRAEGVADCRRVLWVVVGQIREGADTEHADQGNALDTTAFQNKIGEHRHPQLRRPGREPRDV